MVVGVIYLKSNNRVNGGWVGLFNIYDLQGICRYIYIEEIGYQIAT